MTNISECKTSGSYNTYTINSNDPVTAGSRQQHYNPNYTFNLLPFSRNLHFKSRKLFIGKDARPGKKAIAKWYFYAKATATSFSYVYYELCVFPIFKLIATHVEWSSAYAAHQNI